MVRPLSRLAQVGWFSAGAGGALLCALLLLCVVTPPPLARYVGQRLTAELAGRTPLQVKIHAVRWRVWDHVTLEGVRVWLPTGHEVVVDAATAWPDWSALVERRIVVERVAVEGVHFALPLGGETQGAGEPPTGEEEKVEDLRDPPELRLAERLFARLRPLAKVAPGPLTVVTRDVQLRVGEGEGADVLRWDGEIRLPEGPTGAKIEVEGAVGLLEGSGRLHLDARFEGETAQARAHVVAEGFPLDVMAPLVAPRLPEAALSRLVTWPRLVGDFVVTTTPEALGFEGEMRLKGLVVQDKHLASIPVGPLEVGQACVVQVVRASRRLSVDRCKGWLNGVEFHPSGWIEPGEGRPQMDLTVALTQLPYQSFVTALPPEVVPALAGVELGGALDFTLKLVGDLDLPDAFVLDYKADWSQLKLVRSPFPRKPYPLADRAYEPVDPSGHRHSYVLGRGQLGWTPLDAMPRALIDSVLFSEDIAFYSHPGFDEEGLRYAFTQNLKKGRAARGGSTITQQLAKNLFLSKEKTAVRKFQEAVLTYVLEQTLTKQQILETYLNIIEWGPGIYGIGRACGQLFGKPPSALSVKESAYLATIIPNPRRFYGYFQRGELTENWDRHVQSLLDRMLAVGRISPEQYMEAAQEILHFRNPSATGVSYGEGGDDDAGDWEE